MDFINFALEWHHCDNENCDFKMLRIGNLTTHKKTQHSPESEKIWHHCDNENCDFKTLRIGKNKNITHIFILLNPTPSVISKLSKNGTINIDKYPAPTILAAIDALCRTSTVGIVRVVNLLSIPSHNAYQLI